MVVSKNTQPELSVIVTIYSPVPKSEMIGPEPPVDHSKLNGGLPPVMEFSTMIFG